MSHRRRPSGRPSYLARYASLATLLAAGLALVACDDGGGSIGARDGTMEDIGFSGDGAVDSGGGTDAARVCTSPSECDDGNACTDDLCDEGKCDNPPLAAGTSCADDDLCDGTETCDGEGACQPGAAPVCEDDKVCTEDGCDPATGECTNDDIEGCCEADDDCAIDAVCAEGSCNDEHVCVEVAIPGCCVTVDDCEPDQLCATGAGVCVGPAGAGDLVISEFLSDPEAVADAAGEWIEIHNPGAADVILNGWSLAGAEDEEAVLDAPMPLTIAAGGYFVVAVAAMDNGGVAADFVVDSFSLDNGDDRIALLDPFGLVVDEVVYGDGWSLEPGASTSLDSEALDAGTNDDAGAWCTGQMPWADGADRGTPGAPNPACADADTEIDWCRLQWPLDTTEPAGSTFTAFGHVFEAGITDRTDATDVDDRVRAEFGIGPDGTEPGGNDDWQWWPGESNPEWNAAEAEELGNDEYRADATVPSAGSYDFAFRFSRDFGATWLYCDRAAGAGADGSEDGYQVDNAGQLTAEASACDPNPCVDVPPAECDGMVTRRVFRAPGDCRLVDDAPLCEYTFDLDDCSVDGRSCFAGECVEAPPAPAAAGDLLITEILYDPHGPLQEDAAEWFEVHNPTDGVFSLDGCLLADSSNDLVLGNLIVGPGGYLLFARSDDPEANGGLVPDATYDFGLNNSGDSITITCGGTVIDSVAYDDGVVFPDARFMSISLDPGAFDAAANDDGLHWCLGEAVYFGEDDETIHRGTPRAPNPVCPERDVVIDWCRFQHPPEITVQVDQSFDVYGQVFEAGITDQTPAVDFSGDLMAEVGYGLRGSDPDGNADWQWLPAAGNPDWDDVAGESPNNDEYTLELTPAEIGEFDMAFRFSRDRGESWLYCDLAAGPGADGSEDGYQVDNAAHLTVEAIPELCLPNPCDTPSEPLCDADGLTLISFEPIGLCTVQNDEVVCNYDPVRFDCSADGATCDAGACVGGARSPQAANELVITEIMYDVEAPLDEGNAEWFEIYNTTDEALSLRDCVLADSSNEMIVERLVVEAGAYAVLSQSDDSALNGGLEPDALFTFGLNNGGDEVSITCADVLIDRVAYDDGPDFPAATAVSISLDPTRRDAVSNDDGQSWCLTPAGPYSEGHAGTPGAENPSCFEAVDWCRLQWPLDLETTTGELETFYGHVFEAGITDQSPGVDEDERLVGQLGWGPDGSDPDRNDDWVWVDGIANPGWNDVEGGEVGNDEYQIEIVVPLAGAYDHAWRFSADGGVTWLYCDRAAGPGSDGAEDGYQPENAGQLTVGYGANPCDPNPCVRAPAAACEDDGVTLTTYSAPGACELVEDAPVCSYDAESTDCALFGATCEEGICVGGGRPPVAGEVIFTEVMYDPHDDLADEFAEWFELYNNTDEPIALDDCELSDGGTPTVIGTLTLPADGYAFFARTDNPAQNGGLTPNGTFDFALTNGGDSLFLVCDGVEIDRVVYDDGGDFPDAQRFSLSLDPTAYDAAANDEGVNWCLSPAVEEYFPAHRATPGAANPSCANPVDFCRLQFPVDVSITLGDSLTVYGRVFEDGITNRSTAVDEDPTIVGQLGWGPDGSDPAADEGWMWLDAEANPDWDAGAVLAGDEDEYQTQWTPDAIGDFDFAYRFSADGGFSFTYCDRDDGSSNDYAAADAGQLTVAPLEGPCFPNPCDEVPADECADDGVTLLDYPEVGGCEVVDDAPVCAYTAVEVDCGRTGGTCDTGACVGGGTRAPAPGELVITEIMYDIVDPLEESDAEWFEVRNVSDAFLTLDGCTLADSSNEMVLGDVIVAPDELLLFGRSDDTELNGGLDFDVVFGFGLNNDGETLTFTCGADLIESVTYDDGGAFPDAQGVALSLDPTLTDAGTNDDGASWCLSRVAEPYAAGHRGTPGLPNPTCTEVVDFCRLQAPLELDLIPLEWSDVFGRIFEAGLTDQSPQVDLRDDVVAMVGWGPDGSDAASESWTWAPAVPVPMYDGGAAGAPDEDEYVARLTAPLEDGLYAFAFRFSVDGGFSWTYCDREPGSSDGYQPEAAGLLTVERLDPCLPNPCLGPPANACDADGITRLAYPDTGECTNVEGVAECAYPAVETDCAAEAPGGICQAGECISPRRVPQLGEVIFTEILYDPHNAVTDSDGEWFEIYNATDVRLDLDGCTAGDAGGGSLALDGLVLEPRGYALFAISDNAAANGGLVPDAVFEFGLNNGGDSLTLACATGNIDSVAFDDGPDFPDARAVSISLDPAAYDAEANDNGDNWCITPAAAPYGGGQFGTPGAPNGDCAEPVDFCRLQFPLDTEVEPGAEIDVFGRLFETGLTDQTPGPDSARRLFADLGWGPDGVDPAAEGWTWVRANPNVDATGNTGDEDEYIAMLTAPALGGSYDFAYRFSLDAGFTWTYCDRDPGSTNGYAPDDAGQLTVADPDPCNPNPCTAPPANTCDPDGITRVSYPATGACEVVDGLPACDYPSASQDCSAVLPGGRCQGGGCAADGRAPAAGEVFVTEIMFDPHDELVDAEAEWIELYNATDDVIDLAGCRLADAANAEILDTAILAPRSYSLLAHRADPELNGGLVPVALFGLGLNNSGDSITLTCAAIVDTVNYDLEGFPDSQKASISLDPSAHDADANDFGSNWCVTPAPETYFEGHYGTPGAANGDCVRTVDFCRLQSPTEIAAGSGDAVTVYGRLYEAGLTDATAGVDGNHRLAAQLGWGPDGSDPGGEDWVWFGADANPAWDAVAASAGDEDEYMADLFVPDPGSYDYAYRFSLDAGFTWTFCDREAGSDDGYDVDAAGQLTALEPDLCDPNPCDAPPPGSCDADGVTLQTVEPIGDCTQIGDEVQCVYTAISVDCSVDRAGGRCEVGACVGDERAPQAGELVFTEILYDTVDPLADGDAEWFELHNGTQVPLVLDGCEIADGANTDVIDTLIVPADGFALFVADGGGDNGGLVADATFGFGLNNSTDTLTLTCGGVIIDTVTYDGGEDFPEAAGQSLSLDPARFDATENDDGHNWCLTPAGTYTAGHYGSPGAANGDCIEPVDFCRLERPLDTAREPGEVFTVYGRVFEAGITDQSTGVDEGRRLMTQFGWGPDGSDPAGEGWDGVIAVGNPQWDAAAAEAGDEDEYMAELTAPAVEGEFDFVYRVSADGGFTWTYCDRDPGSSNGYDPADAGQLSVVNAGPCQPNPCDAPPPDVCDVDGTTLLANPAVGDCVEVGGNPECTYEPALIDCTALQPGGRCEAGACVGPDRAPDAGEVIFTEIMYDPADPLGDGAAEWFEVYNTSDAPMVLDGCFFTDSSTGFAPIASLTIDVDGYGLFARSDTNNGELAFDAVFGFALNNDTDSLTLNCGGIDIDTITYDDFTFPIGQGASISLDPSAFDTVDNDAGGAWCITPAIDVYFDGNYGTPGAANDNCATPVDFCRLQWPEVFDAEPDQIFEAYGRLYQAGLTDLTPGVDDDRRLIAQLGTGPDNSDPFGEGWDWIDAAPTFDWDSGLAGAGDEDEYTAELQALAAEGEYDIAFRVTLDAGYTWTYCDLAPGSDNGYDPDEAGRLTVASPVDPCEPNPCEAPPADACDPDGVTLVTYAAPGACTDVGGQAECDYTAVEIDCSTQGENGVCEADACVERAARAPAATEVYFTEIMYDPADPLDDANAEWFELYNRSDDFIQLGGCDFGDAIPLPPLQLEPGAYAVFARSADVFDNGGIVADGVFSNGLGNTNDTLVLFCQGVRIDEVNYDERLGFPAAEGESISLDPVFDAFTNDDGASWCRTPGAAYSDGQFGTPGAANADCAVPIDVCRLQQPLDLEIEPGEIISVDGRIDHAGLTDLTDVVDTTRRLLVDAGWGSDASDPTGDDWFWFELAANPAWDAVVAGAGTEDEYTGEVLVPFDEGAYDLAVRFTLDGGFTWTYCDRAPGSADGYAAVDAGQLTVVIADPCLPNPCDAPPATICDADGLTRLTYAPEGICTDNGGDAACDYAETPVDCTAELPFGRCEIDECVSDARAPAAGDLVFDEIMFDAAAVIGDGDGEWFEMRNTAGVPLVLDGCTIADSANTRVIGTLDVDIDGYVVFARDADPVVNGGLAADYVFTFGLNNDTDSLTLTCGGVDIDTVTYVAADFRGAEGFALSRDPNLGEWCVTPAAMYAEDQYGSPGEANADCAEAVEFCRLQWPLDVTLASADTADAYGRVFHPGLTDQSAGVDLGRRQIAEFGLGPDGTDPAVDGGWTWIEGAPTPGWDAVAGNAGDEDEFAAVLTAPVELGDYDFAWRFSLDAGFTWTYCDRESGSGDGYAAGDAGQLTVAVVDPCLAEACDTPPAPECDVDGVTLVVYDAVGECADVDGAAVCTYGTTPEDCSVTIPGGSCFAGACVDPARAPVAGELVFTEYLADPHDVLAEVDGEWFELHNAAAVPLVLDGCTIADSANSEVIGALTVGPGVYAIFARNADSGVNGGLDAVYDYDFGINNDGDTLTLTCDGVVIDTVDFSGGFPFGRKVSTSLDPAFRNASDNDAAGSWCITPAGEYFGEHYGSPGAPNGDCADPVDFCRLQAPLEIDGATDEAVEIAGRLYEAGLTDLTAGVDTDYRLMAEVGFGPDGTDPAVDGGWVWYDAAPNPDWDSALEGNDEDEWLGTIVVPGPGSYDFAYRFTADAGYTWSYCDREPGSSDGYAPADAGQLTAQAATPCNPNPCDASPADTCEPDGVTLTSYPAVGDCTVDGLDALCDYPAIPVDCAAELPRGRCEAGACVTDVRAPVAGEVVFNEVMYDPHDTLDDTTAEWLELWNTADAPITLAGCNLSDAASTELIDALVIDAGGYALFAKDGNGDNGGLVADAVFGFTLNNGLETLSLTCDGVVIDQVSYDDGETFPDARQASISLESTLVAAGDDGASWCLAPGDAPYFNGHYGSPGEANPPCAQGLTFCYLGAPVSIVDASGGEAVQISGHVYAEGFTDATNGPDDIRRLIAQIGYGDDASDPAAGGWSWFPAAGNPGFDHPLEDQYLGDMIVPNAEGDYDFAYRFTLDGGFTWNYCDTFPPGSLDGYQPASAGQMNVAGLDPCDPNPCDAAPVDTCDPDGVTRLTYDAIGACTNNGGVAECDYNEQTLDCATELPAGTCDNGICIGNFELPLAGDLVFTEILYNPHDPLEDLDAEWFELYNTTANALLLDGCVLSDSANSEVLGPILVEPNARALFVRNDANNGGLVPDALFDFSLNNSGDSLDLTCAGGLIDAITFDVGGAFPAAFQVSLSLDPAARDAAANDDGANWCITPAADPYFDGHYGTPGAPNGDCAEPVDFCRLQWPESPLVVAGDATTAVYGRIFEAGLTDGSVGVDGDRRLIAQLGLGDDGTDPAADPSWDWVDAAPTPDWDAAAAAAGDEDEYVATLTVPGVAGTWDFAYRFSLDAGFTWTYCDYAAGSSDGYAPGDAGQLTVVLDPCDPNPCNTPDAARCDDDTTLVTFDAIGECADVGGDPVCTYGETITDCTDGGQADQICVNGACAAPGPRAPVIGDIVFTEVLYDPHDLLAEGNAEWFEIYNTTSDELLLDGCTVGDPSGRDLALDGASIASGDYLLFVRSAVEADNGGLVPDFVFDFSLNNGGDTLRIACADVDIDVIDYDDGITFPNAQKTSISLDAGALDSVANDDGGNWCIAPAADPYGAEHYGTPGGPNGDCAEPVDFCRLQFPETYPADPGEVFAVFGRIYEAGLTDRSLAVDFDRRLMAQLGYGPDGTDPSTDDTDWTWLTASANDAWVPLGNGDEDEDEYLFDLAAPAQTGSYDYAWRFSLDAGYTWTLCDRGDGSSDGYQPAQAGDLVVFDADPCDPNPCEAPPADECDVDGVTAIAYPAVGTCEVVADAPECTYDAVVTDCSLSGDVCVDGACSNAPARAPEVGEMIFNEIVYDTEAPLDENFAEWIELHNPTVFDLGLDGCTVSDASTATVALDGLEVTAGGYLLLARNANPAQNGGLTPDATFGFALNNSGDTLTLTCGGVVIDTVSYDDGGDFPDARQVSISLDPTLRDAEINDSGLSWCISPAGAAYSDDHFGTPGAANGDCARAVDFCRLELPPFISLTTGNTVTVTGRIFEFGITNQTEFVDPDRRLMGQLGFGPSLSDPAVVPEWVWIDAEPTPGWNSAARDAGDEDEYSVDLILPAPGLYDYAYRFTADAGFTWLYCDTEPGSADGYDPADAGKLASLLPLDPCINPNPCTEPPADTCDIDGITLVTYPAEGSCTEVAGEAECTYDPQPVDCSAQGRTCAAGACVAAGRAPVAGEVVFTEFMYDPDNTLDDVTAEWIELSNTTGEDLVLDGCSLIANANAPDGEALGNLVIAAGGYALLAKSADPAQNGGLDPDLVVLVELNNTGDNVALTCGGVEIDRVAFDDGTIFPEGVAISIGLSPANLNAADNDNGGNWCLPPIDVAYAEGHYGTPGAANPDCDVPVDFCRLQWPRAIDVEAGVFTNVYGRIYHPGITDASVNVDTVPRLLAELGIGPDGTDPTANADWDWIAGAPTPDWNSANEGAGDEDEYVAALEAPVEGQYDYAWRFSVDHGRNWTYCDLDAGSSDGYAPADSGPMTTVPPAALCEPNPCTSPPAEACQDAGILLTYADTGECSPFLGNFTCNYDPIPVDCTAIGGFCIADRCQGGAALVEPGDVFFTEIMYDPSGDLSDVTAEWIEIYNPSAGQIALEGCILEDAGGGQSAIPSTVMGPGSEILIAKSDDPAQNGGLDPFSTFSFSLNNDGDTVILRCGGVVIDEVTYDVGDTFPPATGSSLALDQNRLTGGNGAGDNDDGANWCLSPAPDPYSGDNYGSPGGLNRVCGDNVQFCMLQDPPSIVGNPGDIITIAGRVLMIGVTTLTTGVDEERRLFAQLGYGPDGSTPAANPDAWTWLAAGPNPTWNDAAQAGADEYEVDFELPAFLGNLDYAYRFSADSGFTWTYCDLPPGSFDAYSPDNAGQMTISAP